MKYDYREFKEILKTNENQTIFEENYGALMKSNNLVETLTQLNIETNNSLVEYINSQKNVALSIQKYTEGQPVVISDQYQPYARKNGRVISIGDKQGFYKIAFDDDKSDDVPEEYIQPKEVNEGLSKTTISESGEYEAYHFNGEVERVFLEAGATHIDVMIALGESIAIMPNVVTDDFLENSLCEEMTDDQEKEKERIVIGLKKNSERLKKKYGDKWQQVMYAIATKKALNENYLAEQTETLVASKKAFSGGKITLNNNNGNYVFRRFDVSGEVIDEQVFNNFNDAENTFNHQI